MCWIKMLNSATPRYLDDDGLADSILLSQTNYGVPFAESAAGHASRKSPRKRNASQLWCCRVVGLPMNVDGWRLSSTRQASRFGQQASR